MPHLGTRLSILISGSGSKEHHGKVQVAKHGLHLSLKRGESSLIVFDSFRVIVETDTALVGQNDNDVACAAVHISQSPPARKEMPERCRWVVEGFYIPVCM